MAEVGNAARRLLQKTLSRFLVGVPIWLEEGENEVIIMVGLKNRQALALLDPDKRKRLQEFALWLGNYDRSMPPWMYLVLVGVDYLLQRPR